MRYGAIGFAQDSGNIKCLRFLLKISRGHLPFLLGERATKISLYLRPETPSDLSLARSSSKHAPHIIQPGTRYAANTAACCTSQPGGQPEHWLRLMRCTTRRRSSPRCELVELGVRAVTRQRRESSSREASNTTAGSAGAEMSALVSSSTYLLLLEKEPPRSLSDGETRQRPVLRNHIEGTRVPDHGAPSRTRGGDAIELLSAVSGRSALGR